VKLTPMMNMATLARALPVAVLTLAASAAMAQSTVHDQLNAVIEKYRTVDETSMTNPAVKSIFAKDGFAMELEAYPVGELAEGFVWKPGMGASFTGPYSKLPIKVPFTDYLPLPDGPVLDANKTYRIGFVFHGFNHSWLV